MSLGAAKELPTSKSPAATTLTLGSSKRLPMKVRSLNRSQAILRLLSGI